MSSSVRRPPRSASASVRPSPLPLFSAASPSARCSLPAPVCRFVLLKSNLTPWSMARCGHKDLANKSRIPCKSPQSRVSRESAKSKRWLLVPWASRLASPHRSGPFQPADDDAFFCVLDQVLPRYPTRLLFDCLMPTHFYFVLWPEQDRAPSQNGQFRHESG
jgi:hypothetical protein